MTIIGKSAISISTIGALGGFGLYAGGLFNKSIKKPINTYKQILLDEGFSLTISHREWIEILNKYNAKKDIQTTFKTNANDTEEVSSLINKCQNFWNSEKTNEDDYKKLKRWCVKEETIDSILGRAKYKKIDAESNDEVVSKKWEAKTEQLKLNKDSFKDVGVKMSDVKNNNIEELKKGCKALNYDTLKTTADDFIEKFENSRDWCYLKEKD